MLCLRHILRQKLIPARGNEMKSSLQFHAGCVAVVAMTAFIGCSGDDVGRLGGVGKKKSVENETAPKENEDIIATDEVKGKVTKGIESSGSSFQVKDVALLRSSIASCMGAEKLIITEDMLIPVGEVGDQLPDNPDGKFRFLLGNSYQAGDDIVEKERKNLVDFSTGNRTGITSDGLTDTYLRSLETIANVVAHYCDSSVEVCKCGTKEEARVVLERCLPGIDPESDKIDYASLLIYEECKEGDSGVRRAIASLLSSYAFASAR